MGGQWPFRRPCLHIHFASTNFVQNSFFFQLTLSSNCLTSSRPRVAIFEYFYFPKYKQVRLSRPEKLTQILTHQDSILEKSHYCHHCDVVELAKDLLFYL